jgi:Rrf2 family protein
MSNLFRVSEAASLALHAMLFISACPDHSVTTRDMASAMQASEAHLAKVLQRLARVGLVRSTRGPKGGFVLGKSPDSILLLDIYEAIEGPLVATTCLLGRPICGGRDRCMLGGLLESIDKQARQHFAGTRLSDLTKEGPRQNEATQENHPD